MKRGALIGLGFGLLWWLVGASAAPAPARTALQLVGVLLFAGAGVLVWRRPRRAPRGRPRWGWYAVAVAAEIAAVAIAQNWLTAHGRGPLLFPVVGVIVGLHFLGLWLAFSRRRFLLLAGGLVAINLLALAAPLAIGGRLALSGFGSAAALLATALLP